MTLQNLMEHRSEISTLYLSRLSRNEKSKNSSSHHIAFSKSSRTSRSARKSLQYDRTMKLEKATALKTQLSFHAARSK